MKHREKFDNLLTQKISPEQLSSEQAQEKDFIIKNLKDKLEEQRRKDDILTQTLYEEKMKNEVYIYFNKINFPIYYLKIKEIGSH